MLSVLAIFIAGTGYAEAPQRVVSMNLCTDQLAMMLAAPGQLASVSRIATDRNMSPLWKEATEYPPNTGRAEEIYLMNPDLVVAGSYTDPMAVSLLRDLGIEVVQFEITSSVDEIAGQVIKMGDLLGQSEKARSIVRDFEERLTQLKPGDAFRPTAAFFYANGYSLGAGTMSHDIVTRAGFTNLAEKMGRSGGGRLALEDLLMNPPDVLVTSQHYPGASRSEAIMAHDALSELPRVESTAEWVCGTPFVLNAISEMVAAREALTK